MAERRIEPPIPRQGTDQKRKNRICFVGKINGSKSGRNERRKALAGFAANSQYRSHIQTALGNQGFLQVKMTTHRTSLRN
tara:strand:+ start:4096 stop:4335 length:240 start_codon:yes stop_codon:yes gene_type:complete